MVFIFKQFPIYTFAVPTCFALQCIEIIIENHEVEFSGVTDEEYSSGGFGIIYTFEEKGGSQERMRKNVTNRKPPIREDPR